MRQTEIADRTYAKQTEIHDRLVANLEQKNKRDSDLRLKLEQKLKKVTSSEQGELLEEIEEFEMQLQRNRIQTWKTWYESVFTEPSIVNFGEEHRFHN